VRPRLDEGAFVAIPYTVPLAPYERAAFCEANCRDRLIAPVRRPPHRYRATLERRSAVGQDGRAHAIRLMRTEGDADETKLAAVLCWPRRTGLRQTLEINRPLGAEMSPRRRSGKPFSGLERAGHVPDPGRGHHWNAIGTKVYRDGRAGPVANDPRVIADPWKALPTAFPRLIRP